MKLPKSSATGLISGILIGIMVIAGGAHAVPAVFCVSDDGHVEIKQAWTWCCESSNHSEEEPHSCGDCSDFRLELPPFRTKQGPVPLESLDTGAVASAGFPGHRFTGPNTIERPSVAPPSQVLAFLASIVLLT